MYSLATTPGCAGRMSQNASGVGRASIARLTSDMTQSRSDAPGDVGLEPEALTRGRQQYGRRAWAEAYELLSQVEQQSELSASDLELLANAAYLVGRDAEYLSALERAQLAHCHAGALRRAVRCQYWLALRHLLRG